MPGDDQSEAKRLSRVAGTFRELKVWRRHGIAPLYLHTVKEKDVWLTVRHVCVVPPKAHLKPPVRA
jgi:hypothetical protein